MNYNYYLSMAGAAASMMLAVLPFVHGKQPLFHWSFGAGMFVMALERVFSMLASTALTPSDAMLWINWRFVISGFLPPVWLIFSIRYARENYGDILPRWRGMILAAWLLPFVCTVILGRHFFTGVIHLDNESAWKLTLGWPGWVFQICFILTCVLVLTNLEGTIRASSGNIRWRIKFTVIGLGVLFAFRIYSSSQALLFSAVTTTLAVVDAGALIVADLLIIVALFRSRFSFDGIYVSQNLLYNSVTITVVGVYFMAVAVLANVSKYFQTGGSIARNAFLVFLLGLGASVILLSDRFRFGIRRFVSRHFRRPLYDYREIWAAFVKHVVFRGEIRATCTSAARMVSQTINVSAVSIWLLDESRGRPVLCGSSSLSFSNEHMEKYEKIMHYMFLNMREETDILDLDRTEWYLSRGHGETVSRDEVTGEIRYCAPLRSGGEFLGVMTLNDRVGGESLSIEDLDLLKVLGDQASVILLNQRLFGRLQSSKEMEAFQTLSAFFIHDLKNLASTLSLTLQNLPIHYNDPEFREDAMKVLASTAGKINSMCSRLSSMKQDLKLNRVEYDINELVHSTIGAMNGALTSSVSTELNEIPKTLVDPEQMRTVLMNLLINANEAQTERGEIIVRTAREKQSVILSVSDKGCGMSKEFITQSLFHPFRTTKKKGLGIGLYQCKIIVQGHQGTIDVESEKGKGTTFSVALPLQREP